MQVYPTVYAAFCASAAQWPANACIETEDLKLTYRETELQVRRLAHALQHRQKLGKGQPVIVLADNDAHWLIVSLAIQAVGAIEFPLSSTTSSHELAALQKATGCRHFIVADADIVRRHRSFFLKRRSYTTVMSGQASGTRNTDSLAHLLSAVESIKVLRTETSAVSAVICTSGTTGRPKRVPVMQASFLHSMRVIPRLLGIGPNDVFLSCLPSWHLYARIVEYTALAAGAKIVYSAIPGLAEGLRSSGCTIFPSFPEIWEKIYHEILLSLEMHWLGNLIKKLIALSIRINRTLENRASRSRYGQKKPGIFDWVKLGYLLPLRTFLLATVFRSIRRKVSPSLRYAIMGDAPLPLAVDELLRAVGFEVLEGYGSTEQCVTALRRPGRHFPGVIGRVLPGVRLIAHETVSAEWNGMPIGELAVSGDNVFREYFTDMAQLGALADRPGIFLTGDLGFIDNRQNVVIVGRKANAFYLQNGEIIFPELVENVLRGCKFVGRVLIFGSDQNIPVALVVPDFAALLVWLQPHGGYPPELAADPESDRTFWRRTVQSEAVLQLYRFEFRTLLTESGLQQSVWPQGIHIIAHPFHRGKELTMTLKPRRATIAKLYARDLRRAASGRLFP